MKYRLPRILPFSLFLCFSAQATSYYQVRRGDSLSAIAMRSFEGKIYGPNGSLEKILKLNPSIKNPNLIYPNQVIQIKEALQEDLSISEVKEIREELLATYFYNNDTLLSVVPKLFFLR